MRIVARINFVLTGNMSVHHVIGVICVFMEPILIVVNVIMVLLL